MGGCLSASTASHSSESNESKHHHVAQRSDRKAELKVHRSAPEGEEEKQFYVLRKTQDVKVSYDIQERLGAGQVCCTMISHASGCSGSWNEAHLHLYISARLSNYSESLI